jgi:hypothetical protein
MIHRVNIQGGWRKPGGVDLWRSRGTCETRGKGQFFMRSMCNPAVDVTGSGSEEKKIPRRRTQRRTTDCRSRKSMKQRVKKLANVFVGKTSGIYPHGLFGELVSCAPVSKRKMMCLCWRQEQPRPAGGVGGTHFCLGAPLQYEALPPP